MSSPSDTHVPVINYDAGGYDYRQFWQGRDYEHWAEARVLRRLLGRVPPVRWLADFGGGFGRNVPQYRERAAHTVLIDYSWTNLTNAEQALLPNGPGEDIFLIRGNLYHLPFRDGAFELGATVRVIHHLSAIDAALAEMGRTVSQHWILDVPIKHHLLARARAMTRGKGKEMTGWEPNAIGASGEPFYNFHLDAIRHTLRQQGWSAQTVASVANFRRWERVTPGPARSLVRPLVYGAEAAAQRIGRGWWGPSQFLWLSRTGEAMMPDPAHDDAAAGETLPAPWSTLAPRMQCPSCRCSLAWTPDAASCTSCQRTYQRKGAIWDFVVD